MANTLRFKRGLVATIPTAAAGEPLFTTDTFDLYIGNGTTNTRFQKYIASGTTSQLLRGDGSLLTMPIVLTSPSSGQVLKYNGTSWVNDSDSGITGSGSAGQVAYFTGATTQGGSNNLFWDATNSRLGIGTNTPGVTFSELLQLVKSDVSRINITRTNTSGSRQSDILFSEGTTFLFQVGTILGNGTFSDQHWIRGLGNTPMTFRTNDTERFRLTAGGNFIINNPSSDNGLRFQVTGDGSFSGFITANSYIYAGNGSTQTEMRINSSGGANEGPLLRFMKASANVAYIGTYSSIVSGTSNDLTFYSTGSQQWMTNNSGTTKMLLDASGNLGLGVVPSAWSVVSPVIEFTAGGFIASQGPNVNTIYMGSNHFYNGTNFIYKQNGFATQYQVGSGLGNHHWYISASGTAGNAVSFTQAMTLTANGRLLLGTTTEGTQRLQVAGDTIMVGSGNTSATTALTVQNSDSTNMFRVANNGNVAIGDASLIARTNLTVWKNITGDPTSFGIYNRASIQSGVTSEANMFVSVTETQAASFTLAALKHYRALNAGFGAGSAVTNQFGFIAEAELTGATNNYGFYGDIASGTGRWNLYMNGTANNYINGRLLVGTTGNATQSAKVIVDGSAQACQLELVGQTSNGGYLAISSGGASKAFFGNGSNIGLSSVDEVAIRSQAGPLIFQTGGANEAMRILGATRNVHIGTFTSDSGEKLQVNGTIKVTGASTFGGNMTLTSGGTANLRLKGNSTTGIDLQNDAAGSYIWNRDATPLYFATNNTLRLTLDGSTGAATFSSSVTATIFTAPNINVTANNGMYDAATNSVGFQTNGVARMFIGSTGNVGIANTSPSYALDVTGEARVSSAIAIGTTPDTNKPFKILKNINDTVGIRFENTSTGSLAFSALQMGTDVTGGTKFTNLVYASSGVTANGVYQPDGTSLINNGSGGLNFLGNPIRMYTGGSNGTLRWDMTNDGFITQYSGTNPSTNATDGYRQYSADVVAGNAAPHFRTENGAIIKLYQETTAVGNSTISVGGGNAVLDDTEFDGYTLRQIVKALRNQGILA